MLTFIDNPKLKMEFEFQPRESFVSWCISSQEDTWQYLQKLFPETTENSLVLQIHYDTYKSVIYFL